MSVTYIDPQEILRDARRLLQIPVGGDRLTLEEASIVGDLLAIVFRWNDFPELLGIRFTIPDTTGHPAWTMWAPYSVEEWVMYAIRVTLIEEMQTGLLQRGRHEFDGRVTWLHIPAHKDLGSGA